jgi:multidrug efflux system outer membrane protein
MTRYHQHNWIIGCSISAIGLLSSCAVPSKLASKEIAPLPNQYTTPTSQDNTTVAQLQYKDFFKDPHLLALIQEVLAYNYDYKIAMEQVNMAAAFLQSRRGMLFPALQGGIMASGNHYGKHTMEGVGNFDTNLSPNIEEIQKINTAFTPNYFLGLNASWEIDIWGKLKQQKKAAQYRFLATQQGKHLLHSSLVTQAAALYYDLIAYDKEVDILQQNIVLQQEALDIVKIQKEVGRATELAVQQFEAQMNNTEAAVLEIKQYIISTENQLLALMGKYEGNIARSKSIATEGLAYLQQHGNPQHLLQYRPDIQLHYQELLASKADALSARAAFFPSLNLSSSIGFNSFNTASLFNPTSIAYQLLGGLTAPIFQQNQLKSQFKIVTAQQEIAFLNYQKSVTQSYQEVKTLMSYYENNSKIVALKNKEVMALTKGVDLANDLYVTAYANYLEIISAQKSKIQADLDLIKAERQQAHVLIQLYKTLGGG